MLDIEKRNREYIPSGYYFIVQINSVQSDTIRFTTIEIYTPYGTLDKESYSEDTTLEYDDNYYRFCNRQFTIGNLKGSSDKHIGEVLLLKPSKIDNNGFIHFEYFERPDLIDLSKFRVYKRNCR